MFLSDSGSDVILGLGDCGFVALRVRVLSTTRYRAKVNTCHFSCIERL